MGKTEEGAADLAGGPGVDASDRVRRLARILGKVPRACSLLARRPGPMDEGVPVCRGRRGRACQTPWPLDRVLHPGHLVTARAGGGRHGGRTGRTLSASTAAHRAPDAQGPPTEVGWQVNTSSRISLRSTCGHIGADREAGDGEPFQVRAQPSKRCLSYPTPAHKSEPFRPFVQPLFTKTGRFATLFRFPRLTKEPI
jgi:hypothetical protein